MGTLRYFWVLCDNFGYLGLFLGTLCYFEVYIGTLRYSKVVFYILIFLGYLRDIFKISCLRDSLTEFVKDVLDQTKYVLEMRSAHV